MSRNITISGSPDEKIEQLGKIIEELSSRLNEVEGRLTATEGALHGVLMSMLAERNLIDRDQYRDRLLDIVPAIEKLGNADLAEVAAKSLRAYAGRRASTDPVFTVIDGGKDD